MRADVALQRELAGDDLLNRDLLLPAVAARPPRGSDTSLAPQSAHFALARADLRAIDAILNHEGREDLEEHETSRYAFRDLRHLRVVVVYLATGCWSAGTYISRTYCLTMRRVLKRGSTVRIDCLTTRSQRRGIP